MPQKAPVRSTTARTWWIIIIQKSPRTRSTIALSMNVCPYHAICAPASARRAAEREGGAGHLGEKKGLEGRLLGGGVRIALPTGGDAAGVEN